LPVVLPLLLLLFLFTPPPPTQISTLSLHDALPISRLRARDVPARAHDAEHRARLDFQHGGERPAEQRFGARAEHLEPGRVDGAQDRKSTRLNSSHDQISYAVFCLKKKKSK